MHAKLLRLILAAILLPCALTSAAAEHTNPNQGAIDAINDKKALIEAQESLIKAQTSLIKEQYPAFPDSFGKKGELTISEADKVRIAAKSAEAMQKVASELGSIIKADGGRMVILVDADRASIPLYVSEKLLVDRLLLDAAALLGSEPKSEVKNEAVGAAILGIGSVLSQVAQFTQLFRTDKNLTFSTTELPEGFLLDLIAAQTPNQTLYPSADVDFLMTRYGQTDLTKSIEALAVQRGKLEGIADTKRKPAADLLKTKIDGLFEQLVASDPTTKVPNVLTLLRGELASQYLEFAKGRILSVKVLAQGGGSLKTSSIWTSDRYFTSGGVVITYRITSAESPGHVTKAGYLSSDTSFTRVPLD